MSKKYDKLALIADYKTGRFTQRDLAYKYSISPAMVSKITKPISKESESLVNDKIEIEHALTLKSEQEVNAINEVVNKELARKAKAEKMGSHLDSVLGVAIQASAKILSSDPSMNDVMQYGKFQNDARVGLDLQPKFSTQPTVVNTNTNAQQNNDNEINIKFIE